MLVKNIALQYPLHKYALKELIEQSRILMSAPHRSNCSWCSQAHILDVHLLLAGLKTAVLCETELTFVIVFTNVVLRTGTLNLLALWHLKMTSFYILMLWKILHWSTAGMYLAEDDRIILEKEICQQDQDVPKAKLWSLPQNQNAA